MSEVLQPVPAATVVLLRDGAAGLDAWLLTRVTQMAFAAGMSVFPGGRVDDSDVRVPWSGTPPEYFADRFECTADEARSLVGAAVRETFEETGVLLTAPAHDLSAYRVEVEAGRLAFPTLLRRYQLGVDASAVRPWARWVTPPGQPRRYDTHFFVAALPDGAEAADVTTESSVAGWIGVADAVAEAEDGRRAMMTPTITTLESLLPYVTVAEVLAGSDGRALRAIRPERPNARDLPRP
jgi:8-oxo-dGTP pyrophosphatase MutT (NUDIX family)